MNRFDENLRRGAALGCQYRLALGAGARRGGETARTGRRAGESLEFIEYREYQPGDDLRHLDWNVYARSDFLAVKRFREELAPELDLVLDTSASMDLGDTPKAASAWEYAALIAAAAEGSGFGVRLWGAGEKIERLGGGGSEHWRRCAFAGPSATREAAAELSGTLHPGSARILISDLLFAAAPEDILPFLAHDAGGVAVLQLAAPSEWEPAPGRWVLFETESGEGEDLVVTPAMIHRYQENLRAHLGRWEMACVGIGAAFVRLIAGPLRMEPMLEAGVLAI